MVGAHRKHYHTSWACALVELAMMGVSLPAEQVEEAKSKQVGVVQSVRARKKKKADAKRAKEFENYPPTWFEAYGWARSNDEEPEYWLEYAFDDEESPRANSKLVPANFECPVIDVDDPVDYDLNNLRDLEWSAATVVDFDPFAD